MFLLIYSAKTSPSFWATTIVKWAKRFKWKCYEDRQIVNRIHPARKDFKMAHWPQNPGERLKDSGASKGGHNISSTNWYLVITLRFSVVKVGQNAKLTKRARRGQNLARLLKKAISVCAFLHECSGSMMISYWLLMITYVLHFSKDPFLGFLNTKLNKARNWYW